MEKTAEARANGHAQDLDPNVDAIPFVSEGVLAGGVGAGMVASFFLVVDALTRGAFFTPNALGSRFFLGEWPAEGASIEPVLVVGYTSIHLAVFAMVGVVAAFVLAGRLQAHAGRGRLVAALAAALFLFFEATFVVYSLLMAPGALELFGIGRVAVANLLAAIAMAFLLGTGFLRPLFLSRVDR